ncbi:branched-chain amino acid ABC transporter permease [Sulfitobacter mediterraneus]|uniref:branched-chain amino acid ABC transporter permease n=1 Tax=Sulfitobacter mediterraneus TaxID=83219 RepID=UPI00193ACEF0|nr:branched-chain amino acid ABC transporter permease [Sulfitobacter mediterraneus]MBM1555035.1 branched-chain amino acid ABC transporter permease [Sulfitobacter mediterraneus]MBM1567412.1 branched-chain amino acid ABC transporter permease [Sulfitobacter mediterraneus]MBM1571214.1 branched-chain amino acid ABC transporter permease [Sulfitobacter mediterraneus]MBM1575014.1 branched-chain amino acid ABC transporter permease [Sulfitobacter mediterraneus]MBM1577993.1 branched-chain amino acid ABC 
MPEQLAFTIEVFLNGLMAGVLYALVALGFVLIYKASGIFNYAQGVMALFAAMTLVGIQNGQVPFAHLINAILGTDVHHFGWHVHSAIAITLTVAVMVVLAVCVQRFVFRHLVGQEPIILFMATIGLAYFLEGVADLMWGSEIKSLNVCAAEGACLPQGLNLWIDETTYNAFGYGFFIDNLDIVASVVAIVLVIGLVMFAQYTKQGRAMRAVADDHQAALSVGVSLNFIWILVWSLAGFVALVAGIMWGAKSGVQFSLSLIALKALPVLMLGGFTSIPGAIVGGLIIGVGEKLFEFLIGAPFLGGATENWFAYMLALLFLVFRPQGLFGEKIIERV